MRAALTEILAEARAARVALCENELMVRLENIARAAEACLKHQDTKEHQGAPRERRGSTA